MAVRASAGFLDHRNVEVIAEMVSGGSSRQWVVRQPVMALLTIDHQFDRFGRGRLVS